ncbi:MAG TPA: prephenate dehydrogenase [Tepidisphaeraceae bacterium]|nr:prephenate dehydrogenase [Tepidisphaeraceae bacterium]
MRYFYAFEAGPDGPVVRALPPRRWQTVLSALMQLRRVSIVGVGLLGGSIGLALRERMPGCQVVGYGHRASTLIEAMRSGALDEAHEDLPAAVRDADLVVLCAPVGLLATLLREMSPHLSQGTIVTDVGSTKRGIVRAAEELLPAGVHFVGSHPMAGSEKRGVRFARADLFDRAVCIMTPTDQTDASALGKVEAFWKLLGMRLTRLSPAEHDRLLADVSHLPHVVAAALVGMQEEVAFDLCGKGFLDVTRIAGGDGGLWRDILLDNRDNVLASIKRLNEQLRELEVLLEARQPETLEAWLRTASERRQQMLERRDSGE